MLIKSATFGILATKSETSLSRDFAERIDFAELNYAAKPMTSQHKK